METLSEWLQLMLAEITRKQEDAERARAEEAQRAAESDAMAQRGEPEVQRGVGKLSTRTD
jgi:hypothetical protein